MLLLLALSNALAVPVGSPVADTEHGQLRVLGSVTGYGNWDEIGRFPERTLRLDAVPLDGLGLWADGTWITESVTTAGRRQGWETGLGARADLWLGSRVALAATARAGFGTEWTLVSEGHREDRARRADFGVLPALVYGREGGGAYAWIGPAYSLRGQKRLVAGGGGYDWTDGDGRLGLEIGGELHSSDLAGHGLSRRSFLSTGLSLHMVDRLGLSAWAGWAW